MDYSKKDTICIYTNNKKIIQLIQEFAKNKLLKVCSAECETDLIAVPYLFAVVDINKLDEEFFGYIDALAEESLLDEEKLISHTIPNSETRTIYSKYFVINQNLSFTDLANISNTVIN
ncbi:MAG TPA: hypothetical protein VGI61_09795 [Parafilimonas sp.]|jgi:hypothetical protein